MTKSRTLLLLMGVLLLSLQSCTLMLWDSLKDDLKPRAKTTTQYFDVEHASFGRDDAGAQLHLSLYSTDEERVPQPWQGLDFCFASPKPRSLLLEMHERPPKGWKLKKLLVRVKSKEGDEEGNRMLGAQLKLSGELSVAVYAQEIPGSIVPDWIKSHSDDGLSVASSATTYRRAMNRFAGGLCPPVITSERKLLWTPIAWVVTGLELAKTEDVVKLIEEHERRTKEAERGAIDRYALVGRALWEGRVVYKVVPLSAMLFPGAVDEYPRSGMLRWTHTESWQMTQGQCGHANLLRMKFPAHVTWSHSRLAYPSALGQYAWRVLATPFALCVDASLAGIIVAIAMADASLDDED